MFVPIDGNFFTANDFKDSLLEYDEGPLHFDMTNKVIDSDLLVGAGPNQYSEELGNLRRLVAAGRTPNFDPARLEPLITRRR